MSRNLSLDEVWSAWASTQGLDANGDVAYHYAKAGWDAALRSQAALAASGSDEAALCKCGRKHEPGEVKPTREALAREMRHVYGGGTPGWHRDNPVPEDSHWLKVADAVLALLEK